MPRDNRRRNRNFGNFGERVAASHLESKGYEIMERNYNLESKGYEIMERNYSVREGEIDIIAQRDGELIFVEVRSRRGRGMGTPEESITGRKAAHVRAAAAAYVQEHPDAPENQRIDVVALELDAKGRVLRVEQIENAIEDEE